MDIMRSKMAFSGRRLVAAQITSSGVPSAFWILILFIVCCEYLGAQWRHSFMMFVENLLRSWCRLPSVMPAAGRWLLIKVSRAGVAGSATQGIPQVSLLELLWVQRSLSIRYPVRVCRLCDLRHDGW